MDLRAPEFWIFPEDGRSEDGNPLTTWEVPPAPPWRMFRGEPIERAIPPAEKHAAFIVEPWEAEMVNVALHLRRPILVTGPAGAGKSSLAEAVAYTLGLGELLRWPVNTRSTVAEGLYRYDAIARVQDASIGKSVPDIGPYVRLGPLGTALLPATRPRVLLIDEIDKADVDLPNDLLHVLEKGWFEIPELMRAAKTKSKVSLTPCDSEEEQRVEGGRITCHEFPLIFMTSNGEREFPGPFLRRCLRLEMDVPSKDKLERIVKAHLGETWRDWEAEVRPLLKLFDEKNKTGKVAVDQLLNVLFLVRQKQGLTADGKLTGALLRDLDSA